MIVGERVLDSAAFSLSGRCVPWKVALRGDVPYSPFRGRVPRRVVVVGYPQERDVSGQCRLQASLQF